jgi:hypothetical protein
MLAKMVNYGLVSGKEILDIVEHHLRDELLQPAAVCLVERAHNWSRGRKPYAAGEYS